VVQANDLLAQSHGLLELGVIQAWHGGSRHRSCHDLNAGDPHVRSHRTTASFEMVGSPASTAAQRRSSSANSSADSASGTVASVVISAQSSGTDTPRSAALASSAIATRSSTSMKRFGALIEITGSYDLPRLRSWKLAGRAPGINPG